MADDPQSFVSWSATLWVNNKVTFLEKHGTSEFDNPTGAYELDLSLVFNSSAAWRTMHELDKSMLEAGRWILHTFGVRLYTPNGVPGINPTHDWEENDEQPHLLAGRWVSFRFSAFQLIYFGSGVVPLDFLERTDPWNLYPFLTMLPSGRIFVGYYNEARILDPVTFDTVQTLPSIPGAVNNCRTYPLEGSTIPLPQHAPQVIDNCVSIELETEHATWTLERMPEAPAVYVRFVEFPFRDREGSL
ncbi:hypothetical protein GG344DRAFT_69411 [Lentinula edodes]|nr:hypothetical protein GG344DRAFT_69411 [Lentinula edodes]